MYNFHFEQNWVSGFVQPVLSVGYPLSSQYPLCIIQPDPFFRFCYVSLSYLHLCTSVLLYSDVKADKAIEKILISLFTFSPGFPFDFAGFTVKTKYANESGIGSRSHAGGRPSAVGRKSADSAKDKN